MLKRTREQKVNDWMFSADIITLALKGAWHASSVTDCTAFSFLVACSVTE